MDHLLSIKYKNSMEQEDISRSVFQQIGQADEMARQMAAKSIVMVGLSRCGKSTSYNWQVHPDVLVGQRIALNYYYLKNPMHSTSAIIDHKLESVTILPNMAALPDGTHLIDMAGLGDRRDPAKILVVNYTQMTILRSLREAKFLMVVTEAGFKDIANNGFVITIQEFLSLFKLEELSEEERRGFFGSVSLLVTSATEEDKGAYVEQLKLLGNHMEELNAKNPLAIKHYPFVKELIQTLVQNSRVEVFPRAKLNERPAPSSIISTLNAKNWNFFNFQGRHILQSSFLQQIYNLKQDEEKTKLQNIIEWRFKLAYRLRDIVGQLIEEHISSITKKEVNMEGLERLRGQFVENPLYNEVPSFQEDGNDRYMLSLPKRIQIISNIDETGRHILEKSNWEEDQQSPTLEGYFIYLKGFFQKQIKLLSELIGLKKEDRITLKKIEWIFAHIFDEASVIIYMDPEYGARLKINLKEAMTWSNVIDISRNRLLTTFIESLTLNLANNDLDPMNSLQLEETIQFVATIDQQNINASHICKIIIKLRLTQVSKLKDIHNKNQRINATFKCLHNALVNVLKATACFMAVKTGEDIKQELIKYQKDVLSLVLSLLKDQALFIDAIYLADILKQYTLKGDVLQEKANKQGRQSLRELAEYYVKIGDSKMAVKTYNKLGGQLAIQKIKEIEVDSARLLKINGDLTKQQDNTLLNLEKGEEALRVLERINRHIEPLNEKLGEIAQTYKKRMEKYFMDEEQLAYPADPSNYQLITLTQPLLTLIENRPIIIVLSPLPKSGKTLVIGASSGKRLISHDGITFDLLEGPAGKINHGGVSSLFPTISVQPSGESLIEFPHLFQYDPVRQLFLVNLLEKMLKMSSKFKFLIVAREEQITQNNAIQFLRLLIFIRRGLNFIETSSKNNFEQNLDLLRTVALIVTNVEKKPLLLKKLMEIRESLSSNDRKVVVENEKRFGLKEAHQWQIFHIIWNIMHQGRIECLNKPEREKFTLPKLTLLQILSDNTHSNKDWNFGNREMVLNASRLMLADLLESERTAIKLDCQAKISKLNDISKKIAELSTSSYNQIIFNSNSRKVPFQTLTKIVDPALNPLIAQLKLGPFPSSEPVEEQSFVKSRMILPEEEEDQLLDEYQGERRKARIYRDLFETKKIDFFQEFQNYSLPEDYNLYAQKLSSIMIQKLKSVLLLVCSNKLERDILRYTINVVKALPAILGRIGQAFKISQNQEPLLQSLSKIIEMRSYSESMLDLDNNDLKEEFLIHLSFRKMMSQISRFPNLTEATLHNYLKVLENYPLEQVHKNKVQCFTKLIQHYRSWGKTKELILAEIDLLKLITKDEGADLLLKQIAKDAAILLPDHALSICHMLKDPLTKESILEKLVNNSDVPIKIDYIKDRIISLYQLGRAMRPRAQIQFRGLLELVKGDPKKAKEAEDWYKQCAANPETTEQTCSVADIPKDQFDGALKSLVEALINSL